MIVLLFVGIAVLAFVLLYIHKIGVARLLRIIGCAFIAAGDGVDHFGARLKHLKAEERGIQGGTA